MRPGVRVSVGIALLCTGILVPAAWRYSPPAGGAREASAAQQVCAPTAPDAEGPFYKAGAPERSSIGRGLVISGAVRTAGSCAPLPKARIEWWQVNPQGQYDDAHRATQAADAEGQYHFETNFPIAYFGRPPHIHVKVLAPGHRPLTTQIYPKAGQSEIAFDFALRPQ